MYEVSACLRSDTLRTEILRTVQYGVDSVPLLEEHSDGSHNDALEHGLCLEQSGDGDELEFEDVPDRIFLEVREGLSKTALLEHRLSLDLEELQLDKFVVFGKITKMSKILAGLFRATVVHQPTGREWHPNHSDKQNESGE